MDLNRRHLPRISTKPIIIFVLLLVSLPLTALASPMEQIAAEGDTAYREGDYDAALEAYHLVLENGYSSGPLLYNIANAYYKRGELGPAILFYERAARKMPHDRDVRYNLSLARSRAVDKIEPPPRLPVWDWLDTLRDLVPPGLLAMLARAAAGVGSRLLGAAYRVRNRRPRRFLYRF